MMQRTDPTHAHADAPRIGALRVLWVGCTLTVIVLILSQFGLLVAAHWQLQRAVEAGMIEARLPGATPQSVDVAVRRALRGSRLVDALDRFRLTVNQREPCPSRTMPISLRPGDQLAGYLAIDALDLVPDLLGPIGLSLRGQTLRIYCQYQVP